jgi:osmotically-inducible protein OsmY
MIPIARRLTVLAGMLGLVSMLTACGSSPATHQRLEDASINNAIKSRLVTDGGIPLSHISVDTAGGTVYLGGAVPSVEHKQRVEQIARSVNGVGAVVNHIQVNQNLAYAYPPFPAGTYSSAYPPGSYPPGTYPPGYPSAGVAPITPEDPLITNSVKGRLAADRMTSIARVNVDTAGGTVYLNGSVTTPEQRQRAEQIAYEVRGVNKVVNNLQVVP